MMATLEEAQAVLPKLVEIVQQGEEVVITRDGRPVAKLTRVPQTNPSPNREAWLAKLARLREATATGKTSPTVEQILDEDRGD